MNIFKISQIISYHSSRYLFISMCIIFSSTFFYCAEQLLFDSFQFLSADAERFRFDRVLCGPSITAVRKR